MTQQAPAPLPVREEERVLGIAYDRAVRAVPSLVKKATGATGVEELGDGYWVTSFREPDGQTRELTVRLGKQGPDTRFNVRAETTAQGASFVWLMVLVGVFTFGLGYLALIPYLQKRAREGQRARDLLVHKVFRAIEDAVAEQGASPNYRIAAGEGAAEPEREAAEEAEDVPAERRAAAD
jgi:hypothetical protein